MGGCEKWCGYKIFDGLWVVEVYGGYSGVSFHIWCIVLWGAVLSMYEACPSMSELVLFVFLF